MEEEGVEVAGVGEVGRGVPYEERGAVGVYTPEGFVLWGTLAVCF